MNDDVRFGMLLYIMFLYDIVFVRFIVCLLMLMVVLFSIFSLSFVVVMIMLVFRCFLFLSCRLVGVKCVILLVVIDVLFVWIVLNRLLFGMRYRCWFYGL